jgi:hypothetical protein
MYWNKRGKWGVMGGECSSGWRFSCSGEHLLYLNISTFEWCYIKRFGGGVWVRCSSVLLVLRYHVRPVPHLAFFAWIVLHSNINTWKWSRTSGKLRKIPRNTKVFKILYLVEKPAVFLPIFYIIIILIIIIFINCKWVVTRWQWLFYMYTKFEIGYY